jgi:uncharacterized protein (TIGR03000 family)
VVLLTALTTGGAPDQGWPGAGWAAGPAWAGAYAPYGHGVTYYGIAGGYTNCWGGCSGFYAMAGYAAVTPLPALPTPDVRRDGAEMKGERRAPEASRARVVVELPADARLLIDDRPTRQSGGVRVFETPALEAGQEYYYVLRAEVTRDGQKVAQERRVLLRPGAAVRASFGDMADVTAGAK